MMKKHGVRKGWFNESWRHSLAAKGIATGSNRYLRVKPIKTRKFGAPRKAGLTEKQMLRELKKIQSEGGTTLQEEAQKRIDTTEQEEMLERKRELESQRDRAKEALQSVRALRKRMREDDFSLTDEQKDAVNKARELASKQKREAREELRTINRELWRAKREGTIEPLVDKELVKKDRMDRAERTKKAVDVQSAVMLQQVLSGEKRLEDLSGKQQKEMLDLIKGTRVFEKTGKPAPGTEKAIKKERRKVPKKGKDEFKSAADVQREVSAEVRRIETEFIGLPKDPRERKEVFGNVSKEEFERLGGKKFRDSFLPDKSKEAEKKFKQAGLEVVDL